MSTIPIPSSYILGHVVGLSASAFFAFGSSGYAPFAGMTALNNSQLTPSQRAATMGKMFFTQGRPAFLATIGLGLAGYGTALYTASSEDGTKHLLVGMGALGVALVHTVVAMLPVYKAITEVGKESDVAKEELAGKRLATLLTKFYRGNGIRLALYTGAYLCGIYGLSTARAVALL